MELRLLIQNAIDLQLDTAASENVLVPQATFWLSEAEDDRRRDCLAFLEEKQRQAKKAALRTLLRTSPLLGTRLASLAPISFSFLLGLFRFGLF
ncbi:hypothetical protein Bca4012_009122 [Brassica carinata]